MANRNLNDAAKNKNDEFYTQYDDIQREMNCYYLYNKDFLRGKIVFLPCDDPEWSMFTEFFIQNFEIYGLKKLISTSYAKNSKKFIFNPQISLFESESPKFNPKITDFHGKIFTLTEENYVHGAKYPNKLQWEYLEGDGDFRSEEVKALREEADVIITNPPFSLFREFLKWINPAEKKFLIIGNINCITYKEVFPLIMNDKIWLGNGMGRWISGFVVPEGYELYGTEAKINEKGKRIVATNQCLWLTNLEHGKRHKPLKLMTMERNLKYHPKMEHLNEYQKYDNYDAIEVPATDAIPDDYNGVMGVPITFLDKYCPEQFEIIGITKTPLCGDLRTKIYSKQIQHSLNKSAVVTKLNDGACIFSENVPEKFPYYEVDGKFYIALYPRILIRKRQNL